jgi:hypothetical protein
LAKYQAVPVKYPIIDRIAPIARYGRIIKAGMTVPPQ